MGWVSRYKEEHQCSKPSWQGGEHIGDVWKCDDCSLHWKVTHIEFEDRPCGAIWITWEDVRYTD